MARIGVVVMALVWCVLLVVALRTAMSEDWYEKTPIIKLGIVQILAVALWAPLHRLADRSARPSNMPRAANAVGCLFYITVVPTVIILIWWLGEYPCMLLAVVPHVTAAAVLMMRPRPFFGWTAGVTAALIVGCVMAMWAAGGFVRSIFWVFLACFENEHLAFVLLISLVTGSLVGLPIAWWQVRREA